LTSLFNNYARRSLSIVKGQGTVVEDHTGKTYLDFTSGIAVTNLGHAHPAIVQVLQTQSEKLWHISNLFESPAQEKLADALVDNSPLAHAFFCNSGAEANEAAIKLARKHTQKNVIITFEQSFHGRTFGAMSATGQDKVRQGFGPLLETFRTIPFNQIEALHEAIDQDVAAIMIEVIQGEGGVNVIDPAFAKAIQSICDTQDILLIVDEVQTGISRTGTRYAFEQTVLQPDIITLAKGLGNGFPIGAMLGSSALFDSFGPGTHGTTFGGNPLACAVGEYVVETIAHEDFRREVKDKSKYLFQRLNELKSQFPRIIQEVRGRGFMIGIEVGQWAESIKSIGLEKKLMLNVTNGSVVRLLPSLTITYDEIDQFLKLFKDILETI